MLFVLAVLCRRLSVSDTRNDNEKYGTQEKEEKEEKE